MRDALAIERNLEIFGRGRNGLKPTIENRRPLQIRANLSAVFRTFFRIQDSFHSAPFLPFFFVFAR